MADLTQNSANVKLYAGAKTFSVQLGENANAGDTLYYKSDDQKYYKCQADGTEQEAKLAGMLVETGAGDDIVPMAYSGEVDLGATLVVGHVYVPSINVGKWRPSQDIATGSYVSVGGVAVATDKLLLTIKNTGVLK